MSGGSYITSVDQMFVNRRAAMRSRTLCVQGVLEQFWYFHDRRHEAHQHTWVLAEIRQDPNHTVYNKGVSKQPVTLVANCIDSFLPLHNQDSSCSDGIAIKRLVSVSANHYQPNCQPTSTKGRVKGRLNYSAPHLTLEHTAPSVLLKG